MYHKVLSVIAFLTIVTILTMVRIAHSQTPTTIIKPDGTIITCVPYGTVIQCW